MIDDVDKQSASAPLKRAESRVVSGLRNQNNSDFDVSSYSGFSDGISVLSYLDPSKDYFDEAKQVAIAIFDQYMRPGSESQIILPQPIKHRIYEKFGIEMNVTPKLGQNGFKGSMVDVSSGDMHSSLQHQITHVYDEDFEDGEALEINETVLARNICLGLFNEVVKYCQDEWKLPFEQFKMSEEYYILKEEINREEKLYYVMIEAGLSDRLELQ